MLWESLWIRMIDEDRICLRKTEKATSKYATSWISPRDIPHAYWRSRLYYTQHRIKRKAKSKFQNAERSV